jgi:hypothetical protein
VDGDGAPDRVFISVARQVPSRCRYQLVVALDGRRLVAPIEHGWYWRSTRSHIKEYLQLESLISPTPRGLHVVVNVDHSATSDYLAIFGLRAGKLVRLRIEGMPRDHVLRTGGGVSTATVLDCAGAGTRLIISSGLSPQRNGWRVERRVYRMTLGHLLQRVEGLTAHGTVRGYDWIAARFPEFAGGHRAFRSCTVAKRS